MSCVTKSIIEDKILVKTTEMYFEALSLETIANDHKTKKQAKKLMTGCNLVRRYVLADNKLISTIRIFKKVRHYYETIFSQF